MPADSLRFANDLAAFAEGVIGGGLSPQVEAWIAEAGRCRHLPQQALPLLERARAAAPRHPAPVIALYRYYFYSHQFHQAKGMGEDAMAIARSALGPDFGDEPPGDEATRHNAAVRFYLFTLKGLAYLNMRLGDLDEARLMLGELRRLDPQDHVGGALLWHVLTRHEHGTPVDAPADYPVRGWGGSRAMSPTLNPSDTTAVVTADSVDVSEENFAPQHWQGGPINCLDCVHASMQALPQRQGCAPGHACMQDVYARRIDRFFRWHPELADTQLVHPYFEVRAIAARYASVFRLGGLVDDPDETVRMQVALRLPLAQLTRLADDPHREVRIRVAHRLPAAELARLRSDPDYGVRERVAQRLPLAILSTMVHDPDRAVRMCVAQRLAMPALLRMATDSEPEVRRIVAERLPAPLLSQLAYDADWRVRWEVVQRADTALLLVLQDDPDEEVREAVRLRRELVLTSAGVAHG